jgi:non-ribosomal peptide synthetase component F
MVQTLRQAFIEVLREPYKQIGEVNLVSEEDRKQIAIWNEGTPEQVDRCIHELIHQRCQIQPDAAAVCSWDGTITYQELDVMSSILAAYLIRLGVGPEMFVPLCFEKLKWTTVAILGILKAGGAFVLLDLSYPLNHLQDICQRLQARIVVASTTATDFAALLADQVITVSTDTPLWQDINAPQISSLVSNPSVTPGNAAYVVFTSGSTGMPKGVVIEHRAFCSNAMSQSTSLCLTSNSRVLQFASYAFDASILDNLTTLIVGGCICVPSDADRLNHLAKAMNQLEVNWACLTPSVMRILRPEEVPTLKTLVLGGEAATESGIAAWSSRVRCDLHGTTIYHAGFKSKKYWICTKLCYFLDCRLS